MDIKDLKSGATESFFWFNKKRGLLKVLIEKVIHEKGQLKILDLGGGTGTNVKMLKQFGDVYVIDPDINSVMLIAKELVKEKLVGGATNISYPDNFFDIIVASDVLEHVKSDYRAVKEIKRVLKQKGFFIFTLPAFNFLFSSHDKALKHWRRYNKKSVRELLADFSQVKLGFWMFFLFFPVAAIKLIQRKSFPKLHFLKIPKFINKLFGFVLDIENLLIKIDINLPFGITIYGIYKKSS